MPTLVQHERPLIRSTAKTGAETECAKDITTSDFVGLSKKLQLRAAKVSKPKFREQRKFWPLEIT
jgi:hypothetical protein